MSRVSCFFSLRRELTHSRYDARRDGPSQTCKDCSNAANFTAMYAVAASFVFISICVGLYCWKKSREVEQKMEQTQEQFKQRRMSAVQKAKVQVADMMPEKSIAVMKGLHARAETVRRICLNKLAILVYTFQVIYQFTKITTGCACAFWRLLRVLDNVLCVCADEFEFEYPEPAHSSLQVFSMFSWDVMNVAPPECVVADRRTLKPSLRSCAPLMSRTNFQVRQSSK